MIFSITFLRHALGWSLLAFLPSVALAVSESRIVNFELATIEAAARADDGAVQTLTVEGYGQRFVLELATETALFEGWDQAMMERALARGQFYRGTVKDNPDSWVRISKVDGRWTGAWFDGTELYMLDPEPAVRSQLTRAAAPEANLIYRFGDLQLGEFCGAPIALPGYREQLGAAPNYASFAAHLRQSAGVGEAIVRRLRVTLVTDTEFSKIHGADRDAVVAARMAVVDGIYNNQPDTQIGISNLTHLTDNGTLNTVIGDGNDGLLVRFRTYMFSGAGTSIPKGGLNHLLTGKDLAVAENPANTWLAGIAYLDVLCSTSFGYGVSEVRSNNNTASLIIAHELGHNFSARHDGQVGSPCQAQIGTWLMSPSINGSSTFSPCSLNSVSNAISAAPVGCFVAPTSNDLVFSNGFEG